jgi:large subunit ribosomal protein L5
MKQSRLYYWYHQQLSRDIANKIPQYQVLNLEINPIIVLNVCCHQAVMDKKKLIPIILALEVITNQSGLLTQARCSLSTWRLKKGMEIGVKLTLRNKRMWNFLDKLIHIIIPDLVYFNKYTKSSYDELGNLAFGLKNLTVFPEIESLREAQHVLGLIGPITGVDITIVWNNYSNLFKIYKSQEILKSSYFKQFSKLLLENNSWKLSQATNFQFYLKSSI